MNRHCKKPLRTRSRGIVGEGVKFLRALGCGREVDHRVVARVTEVRSRPIVELHHLLPALGVHVGLLDDDGDEKEHARVRMRMYTCKRLQGATNAMMPKKETKCEGRQGVGQVRVKMCKIT